MTTDRELRQQMKDAIARQVGDDAAEVVMQRVAERLGGATHAEAARIHPLPTKEDENEC